MNYKIEKNSVQETLDHSALRAEEYARSCIPDLYRDETAVRLIEADRLRFL